MTRYFWLMMGFFAIYHGLLYDEFFAIPNDWFGTCYDPKMYGQPNPATPGKAYDYIPYKEPYRNEGDQYHDCVYKFGLDPSQNLGNQVLSVTNNIKEKLSVIIAYFHLNFGIVCKALNMIYFGQYQKLVFDVITGFWIFLGLIGYMIVLIYVKWWYAVDPYKDYFTPGTPDYINPADYDKTLFISTSPSIITLMIGDIMGLVGLSDANNEYWQFFDSQQ